MALGYLCGIVVCAALNVVLLVGDGQDGDVILRRVLAFDTLDFFIFREYWEPLKFSEGTLLIRLYQVYLIS